MSAPGARPVLHVLTGCTAAGKTGWALRWAEWKGAEILSCDSLLFYRGMDIGTAKPTPEERARVPHHLVDVAPASEPMNISRYVELARAAAADIRRRGRPVMVVGGSGFYLRSFFRPVTDDVPVTPEIRASVAALLASGGLAALEAELRQLNPGGLGSLDVHNPRRLAAALERCRASGRTLAALAADFAVRPGPFADWEVRLTRVDRAPADLAERIDARAKGMLAAGLSDEVRRLRAEGFERNPSAAHAIGYRETLAVLDGQAPAEGLAEAIARDTRALVKKQRTWFRTQLPDHPVHDAGRLRDPAGLFG